MSQRKYTSNLLQEFESCIFTYGSFLQIQGHICQISIFCWKAELFDSHPTRFVFCSFNPESVHALTLWKSFYSCFEGIVLSEREPKSRNLLVGISFSFSFRLLWYGLGVLSWLPALYQWILHVHMRISNFMEIEKASFGFFILCWSRVSLHTTFGGWVNLIDTFAFRSICTADPTDFYSLRQSSSNSNRHKSPVLWKDETRGARLPFCPTTVPLRSHFSYFCSFQGSSRRYFH